LTGTEFSTPSWDSVGDVWVAGKVHGSWGVWAIPAGATRKAVEVSVRLPPRSGPVTGLRVAPDRVRIALIVGRGARAHLILGAIARRGGGAFITQRGPLGPDLAGRSVVTWSAEDHLLVITQTAGSAQLREVPVNGAGSSLAPPPPASASITAAGPLNSLCVGTSSGRLESSVGLREP